MELQQIMIYMGSEEKPYDFISKFNNIHRVGVSNQIILQDLISGESFTFKVPKKSDIHFSDLILKKEYIVYFDFINSQSSYDTIKFNRIEASVF